MTIGIHVFRKDLRIQDNLALNDLSKVVDVIIPVFVIDDNQITLNDRNQHFFSQRSARFILDCIIDLYKSCGNKLVILRCQLVNNLIMLYVHIFNH